MDSPFAWLAAVEVTINKISLDDPRKKQLEELQAEKISEISKIESKVTDLNKEISEDQMYKLELDSFMKLIDTEKTQKRIMHTLKTGKPLVN